MSRVIDQVKSQLAGTNRKVVFPEATFDERTIRACARLLEEGLLTPVMLGRREDFMTTAEVLGIDIRSALFHYPTDDENLEEMVDLYQRRRAKEGLTRDQARAVLLGDSLLFGAGLVALGKVDAMVAGASHATADVIRSGLKMVGSREGIRTVSSFFLMELEENSGFGIQDLLVFADCAIVPDPDSAQLSEIASNACMDVLKIYPDWEPRVAFLSFATGASADHEAVDKVSKAVEMFSKLHPDVPVDGPMQLDAALIPEVASRKCGGSDVAGRANILIFPDLNSGNIGYKLVERLGGALALGPMVSGLARPVNDLSRGASEQIIYGMGVLSAALSK